MRLELTRVGLLVELANHYTTRGALESMDSDTDRIATNLNLEKIINNTWNQLTVCKQMSLISF